MKRYLLVLLVLISCRKEETKIEKSIYKQPELCVVPNTTTRYIFKGKYVVITSLSDTISMYYINSECVSRNIQNYGVKGLKKAFASQKQYEVENKDYTLSMDTITGAFDGGVLQMVKNYNNYLLSLALKDSTYTLGIKKL